MKTSAPKSTVWYIALVLGVLGLIGHYANVPFLTEYDFYLVLVGFILLVLGTALEGF